MSAQEQMFEVGTVITIPDMGSLRELEELAYDQVVGPEIVEKHKATDAAWSGRVALRNLVRLEGYNGGVINIEVAPIDKPFEALIASTAARGKFVPGHSLAPGNWRNENVDEVRDAIVGFDFSANTASLSLRPTSIYNCRLWFAPNLTFLNKIASGSDHGGIPAVRRGVTIPARAAERLVDGQKAKRIVRLQDL